MNHLRLVATLYASVLLVACSEPATVAAPSDMETSVDSDFETAEVRVGHVRARAVQVPAGYSLVDMNDRGDLLLGAAWLPEGRKRPLALPFTGRSITSKRQILGPGRMIYQSGKVTELPDPCIPFTGALNPGTPEAEPLVYDCVDRPVEISVLAENGDALTQYRQDARGTMFSPLRYLKAWRASDQAWQTVVELGFTEWGYVDAAISDTGIIAMRIATFPWHSTSVILDGNGLLFDDFCPGLPSAFAEPQAIPRAVNNAGEVVGSIDCQQVGSAVTGVRWSRTGMPIGLGGWPSLIDNFGNAAGVRDSDGHAVVWLIDGSAIDLSAAVDNQPVSVRKFLKRGQIFGFAGTQPVLWRFEF